MQQHPNHRATYRLREIAAVVLMLAALTLLASCGSGGEQGGGGGQGGGEQGGGGGEQGGGGGGGNGGGNTSGGQGEGTGGADQRPPIGDMRVIVATPDKQTLNGQRARLNGMEVRSVVSERAFFVGENDAEQLLVLNVGDAVEVAEGQELVVAGRLNVPNPNLEERLSLTPEELTAVEEQDIFLRAPRVKPQEG